MIAEWLDASMPSDLLQALGKDPRLVPYGGGNFGMPLSLIAGQSDPIVPIDRFFVRSNGPVPRIDPDAWRLGVTGHVERPLTLSRQELQALPGRCVSSFLECAGNSRTRFEPLMDGTPWRNDAAGNARWEGVPLGAVLEMAGIRDGAVDVVSRGADFQGMQRGLPVTQARDPDTLLVWSMNGADLPVAHGGPVRLLVPGWAAIASTKWLVELQVLDRAFDGFYNADNYVMYNEAGDAIRPVREMPVKSIIASPTAGANLSPGDQELTGYAWSGQGRVDRVEVSTDGGQSWTDAAIDRVESRWSWVRFQHRWQASPGLKTLLSRATDERRMTQPVTVPWNAKGYLMNAIYSVTVTVS